MDSTKKYCFTELLSECRQIVIPEIQRDYAQGRDNDSAKEVREGFLNSLVPVFAGSEKEVPLDFIYGYEKDGAFELLDGQQRLTTLFILHWLFCPEGNTDLKNVISETEARSRFRYATRISSGKFCDVLVSKSASQIVEIWNQVKRDEPDESKQPMFSEVLKKFDWFEWSWQYDPTVASMLIMMDTVFSVLKLHDIAFGPNMYENLKRIVFHCRDLNDRKYGVFQLGEELYVKMNARGKALSEFDKLKSTLEEEIQLQKKEAIEKTHTSEAKVYWDNIEAGWRSRMDGDWADYFWRTKGISIEGKKPKQVVAAVELYFRKFLNWLIAFHLLEKLMAQENYDERLKKFAQVLIGSCRAVTDSDLVSVVDKYVLAIRLARHIQQPFPRIDFRSLMEDFDSLLIKIKCRGDKEEVKDIAEVLGFGVKWEPSDSRPSILREAIGKDGASHDRRVAVSAILDFARTVTWKQHEQEGSLRSDFVRWMKFVRNCALNRNSTQQIDNPDKELSARKTFRAWISTWARQVKEEQNAPCSLNDFIARQTGLPTAGIEDANIEEERIKAGLRTNEQWNIAINAVEENTYIWGQLRAPLNWACESNAYSVDTFKKYSSKLNAIFPVAEMVKDKLWKALLCLGDYRYQVGYKKTLLTFGDNRDHSWKRYMREGAPVKAPALKQLIDVWLSDRYQNLSLECYLDRLIADIGPTLQDWRKYVLRCKDLSSICCAACGFLMDNISSGVEGHKWLVPGKQVGPSRKAYEVFIRSLYYAERPDSVTVDYRDSREPSATKKNSITFIRGRDRYTVQAVNGGHYLLNYGTTSEQLSADDVYNRLAQANMITCTTTIPHGGVTGADPGDTVALTQ